MSKNNSYDIQYWIWASLNNKFGSSVRLRRSYVARMYEVNRHDTDIECNGVRLEDVSDFLIEHLKHSGYKQESKLSHVYVKAWFDGSNAFKCYFHLNDSMKPNEFFITHHLYKMRSLR